MGKLVCKSCGKIIGKSTYKIGCSGGCEAWYHARCVQLTDSEAEDFVKTKKHWFCVSCKSKVSVVVNNSSLSSPKNLSSVNIASSSSCSTSTESARANPLLEHAAARRASFYAAQPVDPVPSFLAVNEFSLKDACLAISQLHQVILEQNNTIHSMLNELKSLKNDKDKIVALELQVNEFRTELETLKLSLSPSNGNAVRDGTPEATDSESVIREIQDRSNKSRNIIIHNLAETSSNDINTRINHDNNLVKNMLDEIGVSAESFKSIRIGRPNEGARPLRVVFPSQELVMNCLKNRKKLTENASSIRISADMTFFQRSHIRMLHQELARRRQLGEIDLIIRYFRGVPKIIKKKDAPKNGES